MHKKPSIYLGILLFQFFLYKGLVLLPSFLELYREYYVQLSFFLLKISNGLPISLGDFSYAFLAYFLLIRTIKLFRSTKEKKLWRLLSGGLLLVNVFYFLFHFMWGFNYYQVSLTELYSTENIQQVELEELAEDLLLECLVLREEVGVEYNLGMDLTVLQVLFQSQVVNLPKEFPYRQPLKSKIKQSVYSQLMNYQGLLGYFNPFSHEAQYNSDMPLVKYAHTLAHEYSHQLGYAPENEANYVGYLLLIDLPSPALQYSAKYKALKTILYQLYQLDPPVAKAFFSRFSVQMNADYEEEKAYAQKYQGKVMDWQQTVNDWYLKSNNQAEGVETYSQFIDLLIGQQRKNNSI